MNHVVRTHLAEKKPRASAGTVKRAAASALSQTKRVAGLSTELADSVEDEVLNAIADERAAGPFVKVSLSDL